MIIEDHRDGATRKRPDWCSLVRTTLGENRLFNTLLVTRRIRYSLFFMNVGDPYFT